MYPTASCRLGTSPLVTSFDDPSKASSKHGISTSPRSEQHQHKLGSHGSTKNQHERGTQPRKPGSSLGSRGSASASTVASSDPSAIAAGVVRQGGKRSGKGPHAASGVGSRGVSLDGRSHTDNAIPARSLGKAADCPAASDVAFSGPLTIGGRS